MNILSFPVTINGNKAGHTKAPIANKNASQQIYGMQ